MGIVTGAESRRARRGEQAMNPLLALQHYGQSAWLDYIRRSLIVTGELERLVDRDGLRGLTSNPTIFEKAISGSTDYEDALEALRARRDLDTQAIYEALAIADIQEAAAVMRPVYEATTRRDGFVSLEVSPQLAHDTAGTIAEARRLWRAVGRPNVMIKVPATREGIPAIQQLISEGINVNITLLFSQHVYESVAEAYLAGLEALATRSEDLSGVASVASFFISRIDTAIDALVTARLKGTAAADERALLQGLLGKVAIANAKLTYERYKEILGGERWRRVEEKGARTQRLLWASTSTKDPQYRDVLYVEELIGPDTVNTMPPATLDAFRDHGRPRASLEERLDEAFDSMSALSAVGISMHEITERLLDEGVKLFADSFAKLLQAIERKCAPTPVARQTYSLPADLERRVRASLNDWQTQGKAARVWARDASLWTGSDEADWLGWLGVTEERLAHVSHLQAIAADVRQAGFSHVLILGMGGSSLCPEVMGTTFDKIDGSPQLQVLDSTDPAQVRAVEQNVDLASTLFIVSSKSGTTVEPNIFMQYFLERVKRTVGAAHAGDRFIAVTDPRSTLQQTAETHGFRRVFFGVPSIGGRYSALSDFGMVPSAIMGIDVIRFLDHADEMVQACASCVPAAENPGVVLGTILGVLAGQGRDKVTILTSPRISDLGAWLEQLLAESTGKAGKGLIPVDREQPGPPEVYGDDRVFVYVRLESEPDASQDRAVEALERAGQPVVRIPVADVYDLGQEFFRWEMATAVAGSLLRINPFNQPDVEASKVATRQLTSEYERTGRLPSDMPLLADQGIRLFADPNNAAAVKDAAGGRGLVAYLAAHLDRLRPRDYFAVLAYVHMNAAHHQRLQAMRHTVRDRKRVATCLGYGPRFLHSTGQAYKGGPNSGVFLQITCDDGADIPVPGQRYTFGVVKAAQARGDFQVLADRGRRLLRVHLGADVAAGLATLEAAIDQALA